MELFYYPLNDYGPLMKGLVIGSLGIFHVFLAQFAIGGGLLMCYFQWLAQNNKEPYAQRFLDSYFRFIVLISFVLGAVTGVGMWFTSIQVSARTIGLMVLEFHWLWAVEYTFFALEIFAGYMFYRYSSRLGHRDRMTLLVLYTTAAWFSLFWINGILSWQLTPGHWPQTHQTWAGFFNPSFWPSLIFRTVVAMTIAALVACIVINTMNDLDRAAKTSLINRAAHFLASLGVMPALGIWYLSSMPYDSRSWVLGGSPTMTLFLMVSVLASLSIGLYALLGLLRQKLYVNIATASLLCALAFGATAGGEFVREGARKPYTIRNTLYSNSMTQSEVERLRRIGSVTLDPYPMKNETSYPNDQIRLGAKVYRFQCSVCHTLDGANSVAHLTATWTPDQSRMNIAKLQHTKPFMPPFAGTSEEVEGLVQMLSWYNAGQPKTWPVSNHSDTLSQIQKWLDDAGTDPAVSRLPHKDRVR
jgi:cytochrome bd ubiquinol oxidase subunit I